MKYNSKGELGNFLWCLLLLQEISGKNISQRNEIKSTLHKFLCRNGIEKVFMSFIVPWNNIPSYFAFPKVQTKYTTRKSVQPIKSIEKIQCFFSDFPNSHIYCVYQIYQ